LQLVAARFSGVSAPGLYPLVSWMIEPSDFLPSVTAWPD